MRDRRLPVLSTAIPGARSNAASTLVIRQPGAERTHEYSQLFRNGYFETVKVLTASPEELAVLGSVAYEHEFIALV